MTVNDLFVLLLICRTGSSALGGQQPRKHYGITSSISLAFPREIDHIYTQKLTEAMKPFGVFEGENELNHRWAKSFAFCYWISHWFSAEAVVVFYALQTDTFTH